MKRISDEDANRIYQHIEKAIKIYSKGYEASDGSLGMDGNIIDNITQAIHTLKFWNDNTQWL